MAASERTIGDQKFQRMRNNAPTVDEMISGKESREDQDCAHDTGYTSLS